MYSRDHSWLHGDEHLQDSDKVEQLQKQYEKEGWYLLRLMNMVAEENS